MLIVNIWNLIILLQGSLGELESRSPTPTPPLLEPEVPLPRPGDVTEAEVEQAPDPENSEQAEVEVDEEEEAAKYIPRLLDAAGNVTPRSRDQNLEPAEWSVQNVTAFLEVRSSLLSGDSNNMVFSGQRVFKSGSQLYGESCGWD